MLSQKIILIGFMGVGKSTIARAVADQLAVPCIDVDQVVESRTKKSISTIFKTEGEAFFRALEFRLFKEIIEQDETCVIATGGGLATHPEFYKILNQRQSTKTFYLRLNAKDLSERLMQDQEHRPLLNGLTSTQLVAKVTARLRIRRKFYNKANVSINVKGKTIEQISLRVLKHLED